MTLPLLGLWLLGCLPLAWISRKALARPGCHGFYRFFAFVSIWALLIHNGPHWFEDRYAPHQLVSWLLLFTALYMVLHGSWLLRRYGRPDSARQDQTLLEFEKTRLLVSRGIYRWVRHPLYASLLMVAWGIFLKQPIWITGLWAALASLCLLATARVEERESLAFFGQDYADYMRRTARFVPLVF